MADITEQNLPSTSQSLDVCQILQAEDLNQSCQSLHTMFNKNINDAVIKLSQNLDNEWNHAINTHPSILTPDVTTNLNQFVRPVFVALDSFINRCNTKQSTIIAYLPEIARLRQEYYSKLTNYYEALRNFALNKTDETRMALAGLEKEKDTARRKHNEIVIDYNSLVLDLQLELDNLKQGIITELDPVSDQERIILFNEILNSVRVPLLPGETIEQKRARDEEFDSWKEMLRLPSQWLIEVQTPRMEVSGYEEFNPMDIDVTSNIDISNIPSTSGVQEHIPLSSIQQSTREQSPTLFTERPSSERELNVPSSPFEVSSPNHHMSPLLIQLSSNELSSTSARSSSREFDTSDKRALLNHKHQKNKESIRKLTKDCQTIYDRIKYYTRSDRFENNYTKIQQLKTVIQELKTEWQTIRANVEDDSSRRRDERSRDRRGDEDIRRPYAVRITVEKIESLYNEWTKIRNELKPYESTINEVLNKISKLKETLDNLNEEMKNNDDDEQLIAEEERIRDDLKKLRKIVRSIKEHFIKLRRIYWNIENELDKKLPKLINSLERKKVKLQRRINRSQSVRG